MSVLRLDRMLSGQGYGTRKEIKELLGRGAVTVNGKSISSSAIKIDTEKDKVSVQGEPVLYSAHVYIMMNKPSGVISSTEDPKKQTVIDLLPQNLRRPGLFPAGRLDRDTEGFMLITDDGNFAHNILSPKKHVEKQYVAELDGSLNEAEIARFCGGIEIDGGVKCLPARLEVLSEAGGGGESPDWGFRVLVTIHEGKYHQIKRMFEALGRSVVQLRRVSMGGLRLDSDLAPGAARALTPEEVSLISG